MKYFITWLSTVFVAITAQSASVKGIITNKEGDPLPYASVHIKRSTIGTTANSNGQFSLDLSPGTYTLVCQYVGYKTKEQIITIGKEDILVTFTLEEQQYTLKDVEVRTGGEDPAYAIIRNAIGKRQQHLEELKRFQCEVYIKGQLKLRDYPKKFMGERVDFEDGDTGKNKMLFLSETVARYSVDGTDRSKIEVLSTRVSGNSDGFGLASPQIISFYQNTISLGRGLNPRGFISPISNNALNYYRYKLEGTYFENGKEINHIKVIPRREYEPLFHGYIDIIEDEWRIHSVQLMLLKTSQMQFLDTLRIEQIYVPAATTAVIKQQVIYPAGKIFSFDFHGSFVQVYDKFNLSPEFEKNFFNNTYIKIFDSANKKTLDYWDTIRPVPLLDEEVTDYKRKDSLEQVRKDPKYLDSLDRRANRPSVMGIVLRGYNYSKRKSGLNISFNALLDAMNFNTVEGAVINLTPTISRSYEGSRRYWSVTPSFRYGFSNEGFKAHLSTGYNFGKKYSNNLTLSFGKRVFQFNNAQPITARLNTFSTLYWENNFMKIYEADFAALGYTRSLGDGFSVNTQLQYQDRKPMENTTDHTWRNIENKSYTPNYPVELTNENILPHQALVASIGLSWQPGTRYIETPTGKFSIGSKYPRLAVTVTQGIKGLAGSDVEYTKWRFNVSDNLNMKIGGRISYRLAVGGFIDDKAVFLPDYQHYLGNQLSIATNYLAGFQLMPYYKYSNTAPLYTTAHIEYHLNGLITNKLPLLRKWNWFIVTGSNTLYINSNSYHAEVFVGLENILKIIRVDYNRSFGKGINNHGITFSMPFLVGRRDN